MEKHSSWEFIHLPTAISWLGLEDLSEKVVEPTAISWLGLEVIPEKVVEPPAGEVIQFNFGYLCQLAFAKWNFFLNVR